MINDRPVGSPPRVLLGMRIAIGSDHAGFQLKAAVVEQLKAAAHQVTDVGTHSEESTDYPLYGHAVARQVAEGAVDLGIVICGSGNGINITANKHPGIRAALAWEPEVAALARQHNDANVLSLPARFVSVEKARAIVDAFLAARFEGGRHQRRVTGIEDKAEATS